MNYLVFSGKNYHTWYFCGSFGYFVDFRGQRLSKVAKLGIFKFTYSSIQVIAWLQYLNLVSFSTQLNFYITKQRKANIYPIPRKKVSVSNKLSQDDIHAQTMESKKSWLFDSVVCKDKHIQKNTKIFLTTNTHLYESVCRQRIFSYYWN